MLSTHKKICLVKLPLSNFNLKNNEEWKHSYKLMKEYEMLGFLFIRTSS